MEQQPAPSRIEQFKGFLSWLLFFSRALAVSVEVFLHHGRSFGERYLGLHAAAAAAILFFFPVFWEEHDPRPIRWYLLAYAAMCVLIRAAAGIRRLRGGRAEHSYYSGRPRLMRFFRRISEVRIKSVLEPALVVLVGLAVADANEPLGTYLMLAGVGLGISVSATIRQERGRILDMNDALLDQRCITEKWRSGRRD